MKAHVALLLAALAAPAIGAAGSPPSYPATKKGDVVDDYHGSKVADPYRWLEDLEAPATREWIAAQNALTFGYLETVPGREGIRKRLTALWNYPRTGLPVREAGRLFSLRNSGLEKQSRLFMRNALGDEPKLLVDPNTLSPDGSVAFAQWAVSPDGRYLAYGLAQGGADWQTIHVREIATGRELPDRIEWFRFSAISWTKDGAGFFYARFPEPPKGQELSAALEHHRLFYHRVGTAQAADRLIYERKDLPKWFVGGGVTEDGRMLVIYLNEGSDPRNRLYYASLGDPLHPRVDAKVVPLVDEDIAEFQVIGNRGTTLFARTDLDAPKRRVIAIDTRLPGGRAGWKTIVPEREYPLEDVVIAGGKVFGGYLVDVKARIDVYSLDGAREGELTLPGVGTVPALGGREDGDELFYAFTSPLSPTTVYRYDIKSRAAAPFEPPPAVFDVSRYETTQVFYTSKDGTRVPMFVTAKKGLVRDGGNPLWLTAYGGFAVSTRPSYSPWVSAWLEMGGVYAVPNLRGGGEYGEEWHKAGMREKKQNVFDDFIAAAEYLVRAKYTSPARLVIEGGSNGGLLVGAAMTQRPELFAVALPAVGVMDMLRYDRFTGGAAWTAEYGSATEPAAFGFLRRYSPLQNLKPGTCYPATLVTTADHDDRVVPSHSYKFTAALQAAQGCDKPALLRVETQGSHGYRPTDKAIAQRADLMAFVAGQLGLSPPPDSPGSAQAQLARRDEALLDAARRGDVEAVRLALDQGAPVNTANSHGSTALLLAADKGQDAVARLLVERGADLDAHDRFFGQTPLGAALGAGRLDLARFLIEKGASDAADALGTAIEKGDLSLAKAALASGRVEPLELEAARREAKAKDNPAVQSLLAGAAPGSRPRPAYEPPSARLDALTAPRYRAQGGPSAPDVEAKVSRRAGRLLVSVPGQPDLDVRAVREDYFETAEGNASVAFNGRGGLVEGMAVNRGGAVTRYRVVTADPTELPTASAVTSVKAPRTAPIDWPWFRGAAASGVGDGQGAPLSWDVATRRNVRFRTEIPGMGNSSPIVWKERIFVTTAVSGSGDRTFRTGLYGDGTAVEDVSEHSFRLLALDKATGTVLWEREVHRASPGAKRHLKSSQANSTPATDGERVVVLFGAAGVLAAYDLDGALAWKKDVGVLDAGDSVFGNTEWGHASSPLIYNNLVIVQADCKKDSFLAAYRIATGEEVWKVARDEFSTWGSPNILPGASGDELVTNGTTVRGYEPATGRLLWTLKPNSQNVIATPVIGRGLAYVTAGYPPVRPIYAIRPGHRGDLSLPEGQTTSAAIAWSRQRGGTYIPTPLLYGEYLYTVNTNGIIACYRADTGDPVYETRVGGTGGAFSASPIGADGRLYVAAETGEVYVLRAGEKQELLAKNEMGEVVMATPALSDGLLVVRTLGHLVGIADTAVAGAGGH
jgi:prolyl oligopeptidase